MRAWKDCTVNVDDYVHETADGRFVVAQWLKQNASYVASMTRSAQRLSGCSQVSSRTIAGIYSDPCVVSYKRRSDAIRAAAKTYDWECADGTSQYDPSRIVDCK